MDKRKGKRRKLRLQLVFMNISMILIIIFVFSIVMIVTVFSQIHKAAVESLTDKSYNSQIYSMRYFMSGQPVNLESVAPYFAKYLAGTTGLEIQIYDKEKLLAESTHRETPIFVSEDVQQAVSSKAYIFVPYMGNVWLSFSSPMLLDDGSSIGVIRYLYPMQAEYQLLAQLTTVLVILALAAVFASFAVGFLFCRKITKPIYSLTDMVSGMKEGNLQQRIVLESGNEIDELSDAFNLMCERMEGYINLLNQQQQQQRQFFNNTTHQLKTPLTSIIGYSQMIQLHSDNDQVCEDAFVIEEAGETLLASIERILEKSRTQVAWVPLEFSSFNLVTMVTECLNLMRPRLDKWRIRAINDCDRRIILHSDCRLGKEVVLTLLDNAILHSGCDTIRIWYEVNGETHEVLLHIRDNGCGISEGDAKYVFNAFYRVSSSAASGNGLGLAVCKDFMHRLGGNITLVQGQGEGCEFVLSIPMLQ